MATIPPTAILFLGFGVHVSEINADDELAALARDPGTTVTIVGDQLHLFGGHQSMVKVTNGHTCIICTLQKAATFKLFPDT